MGNAGCRFLWTLFWLITVSVLSWLGSVESAKILAFFPHPLAGHQEVVRPVVEALGERGHAVTFVSGFPWKSRSPNVEHRVVSLKFMSELKNKVYDYSLEPLSSAYLTMFNAILFGRLTELNEAKMFISKKLVQDPVVHDLIHNHSEKYDLVMTDVFDGYEQFSALTHRFNATGVVLLARGESSWVNELSGLPDNPAYMVDSMSPYFGDRQMPRMSRLYNFLAQQSTNFHGYKHLVQSQAFVDKFFRYPGWQNRPPLTKLVCDQALVLVNTHHSTGHSYPRAPHVKEIGGVSVQQLTPLPSKVLRFVEKAKDGVIFFSPGTSLDFSSPYKAAERNIFLEVFSKRKERVIWKWNGDLLKQKPDNIMFLRDLPEKDILSHNYTKLFISQGGMLDMMAAVRFAVPVLGIVSTEEGKNNLKIAKGTGYALDLNFDDLSIETLNDTIEEMIVNPSFRNKASERSKIFQDRRLKPTEEAVFWIEYVLRHGPVLQPPSVKMAYEEVNLWNVYALAGLLSLSAFMILFMIFAAIALVITWGVQGRSPALIAFVNGTKDKTN